MAYIYAEHEIEDYGQWERHHEDNADRRAAHGSLGTQAFRPADDENTVVVLQEVADDRLAEALSYYDSEAFAETLESAGVVSVAASAVLAKVHEQDA
ncbi:cyclase [Halorientalis pallida]|uniref:Cyclase n=1 Tax=Halorientalis pallida TaxID=2479928 RepID=A0A498KSQ0_9EURY|nr:cyclase [Halorientalis pallida]RXK46879.1 cyclase [Halorientalis pallida]